ncbi:hypothetical protein TNCV_4340491 [Trichonephila clavipes]|nr:hypothetical protein TNCV_4340491 [Trichonephila clavipes]
MVSLGHPSLPPTDLGRIDDEGASPGGRPLKNGDRAASPLVKFVEREQARGPLPSPECSPSKLGGPS